MKELYNLVIKGTIETTITVNKNRLESEAEIDLKKATEIFNEEIKHRFGEGTRITKMGVTIQKIERLPREKTIAHIAKFNSKNYVSPFDVIIVEELPVYKSESLKDETFLKELLSFYPNVLNEKDESLHVARNPRGSRDRVYDDKHTRFETLFHDSHINYGTYHEVEYVAELDLFKRKETKK